MIKTHKNGRITLTSTSIVHLMVGKVVEVVIISAMLLVHVDKHTTVVDVPEPWIWYWRIYNGYFTYISSKYIVLL
jgi:hypothetical protein